MSIDDWFPQGCSEIVAQYLCLSKMIIRTGFLRWRLVCISLETAASSSLSGCSGLQMQLRGYLFLFVGGMFTAEGLINESADAIVKRNTDLNHFLFILYS